MRKKMKKVIVSMMMGMALIAGGSVFAQAPANGTTGATTQTSCCNANGQCTTTPAKAARTQFNPFDGIQLTDDQQQRLQVLQQGLGPVVLTPEEKAKVKENSNLTPEQKRQLKEEKRAQKKEAKKKYLSGVKEILTPDQYVVFLENCYIYSPVEKSKAKVKGAKGNKANKQKGAKAGKGSKGKKAKKGAKNS